MDWRQKPRKKKSKIWKIPKNELEVIVQNSQTLFDILKKFEMDGSSSNYVVLKNRLNYEKIDFSHIKLGLNSNKGKKKTGKKIPLSEILVEHSDYDRGLLKKRLINDGYLINVCSECGIGPEWNGKSLSLQIDHINGTADDNRLENLRILCPNCHAQTGTFGAKRKRGTKKNSK